VAYHKFVQGGAPSQEEPAPPAVGEGAGAPQHKKKR